MLPRRAQKSGTGQSTLLANRTSTEPNSVLYPVAEERMLTAADITQTYIASENLDDLIARAREDMERAAKALDFLAAARYRDRMYELQKLKKENGR